MRNNILVTSGLAMALVAIVLPSAASAVDKRASNYWLRLQAAATVIQPTGSISYGNDAPIGDLDDLGLDDQVVAPVW